MPAGRQQLFSEKLTTQHYGTVQTCMPQYEGSDEYRHQGNSNSLFSAR